MEIGIWPSNSSIAARHSFSGSSSRAETPRSAAKRAARPSSVPRSSMESEMSRSENAFTMKPPEGMASNSPSSSSRTSAMRTGVREAPVVSTAWSSEMRSPGRNEPDRIWSRSASCAFTVCETERSTSRSAMPLLRGLEMLWRIFLRDHLVDQLARPHRPGVDVEIVEDAIRVLVHRALLRLEDQLVLVEDAGDALADLGGDAVLGELVVAHEGP